jgi:hypothetical protein
VPHRLANVQSPDLPTDVDIVIIGSGITGASVAKSLLENHPSIRVTVLEARTLCSGATGRNGGQLATNAGEIYSQYKESFGKEIAGDIATFTFQTCERMKEIIAQYAPEHAEYRDVTKMRAFLDEATFSAMKASICAMEEDHAHLRGIYQVIDKEKLLKVSSSGSHFSRSHSFCFFFFGAFIVFSMLTNFRSMVFTVPPGVSPSKQESCGPTGL